MTDILHEHIRQENKAYSMLKAAGYNPQGWNDSDNTVTVGVPLMPTIDGWNYDYKCFSSYSEAAKALL